MTDTAFQSDWFSKPGDTILALMEERELSAEALADKLGCGPSFVRALLAGTVAVDTTLADKLAKHVGGTSSFWTTRQSKYAAALSRAANAVSPASKMSWLKQFPHRDITQFGWLEDVADREKRVSAYLAYFGVNSPKEWEDRYASFLKETAFRASSTFASKIGAISAWLRQGEIEASAVQCRPWSASGLTSRLDELKTLTKAKNPSYFLPRLRRICAEQGVAVVFVRSPTGCAASGATRFISSSKAMVILSFRHLSDDHFWFTFFHELGHLLLHNEKLTFIDGEAGISSEMEEQANRFAANQLVSPDRSDELEDLIPRRDQIIRFAYSVGVSPGIIVGQLQHRGVLRPNQMNFLKRRFDWEQIAAALN